MGRFLRQLLWGEAFVCALGIPAVYAIVPEGSRSVTMAAVVGILCGCAGCVFSDIVDQWWRKAPK